MISIRNIVTVDFDIVTENGVLGDFETTVYFAPITMQDEGGIPTNILLINDARQIDTQLSGNDTAILSVRNYFANGGVKLIVINPSVYTLDGFLKDIEAARRITRDFIYICISNQLTGEHGYTTEFSKIAEYCDQTLSPEKLRLLVTTNSLNYISENNFTNSSMIVKYCTKTFNNNLIDAALLIGAYLSKINLDGADTIKDYSYTREVINGITGDAAENVSQEQFEQLTGNADGQGYYNFIDKIGNSVVNFGGNLATAEGISIHTDFGSIAIERDISYSVLEKMIGKQYLTEQGISNIKAAINQNLQRYKTNGYLNLEAAYSGEDLVITYNGKKYPVIKNGKVLQQGFYIFSVPVADISVADKQAKKFPPIYVILETQSGARVVEITGEIR